MVVVVGAAEDLLTDSIYFSSVKLELMSDRMMRMMGRWC